MTTIVFSFGVASTIGRLVSFFPPEEQLQVRARLADNLKAVISLRLLINKKQSLHFRFDLFASGYFFL